MRVTDCSLTKAMSTLKETMEGLAGRTGIVTTGPVVAVAIVVVLLFGFLWESSDDVGGYGDIRIVLSEFFYNFFDGGCGISPVH